jgi:hypothetical protein
MRTIADAMMASTFSMQAGLACRASHVCKAVNPALIRPFTPASCAFKAHSRKLKCLKHRQFWRSARAAAMPATVAQAASLQLLIVGPGVLGSNLGKQWIEKFGAGTVVGQTNTTNNHAKCGPPLSRCWPPLWRNAPSPPSL